MRLKVGKKPLLGLLMACLLSHCDLFTPRTPEQPIGNAGTWQQPDTPQRVIENLRSALAERNVQNYLRSLSNTLLFKPTLEAETRDPILWTAWRLAEEETYFNRLRTAATLFSGHGLELLNVEQVILDNTHVSFDAAYQLRMPHSRTDENIPSYVQGRLVWTMVQGTDGLWRLERWVDQGTNGAPSWSDLKAAFSK